MMFALSPLSLHRTLALVACGTLALAACDSSDGDGPAATGDAAVGGSGGAPVGGSGVEPVGGTPVGGDPVGGAGGEPVGGDPVGGAGGEPVGGEPVGGGGSGGEPVGGGGGAGGEPPPALDFSTAALIEAYIDGKALVMAGEDIPSHPNGYSEDVNFGQATQCYASVTMTFGAAIFHVVSELGTLENAPQQGDTGECNHDLVLAPVTFDSVSHVIENVTDNGACFDFTVNYGAFGQEGRGRISPDTIELELYFKDQATGIRCADGLPGDGATALNGAPFDGNALQVFRITP
jgi:hypothetical protein